MEGSGSPQFSSALSKNGLPEPADSGKFEGVMTNLRRRWAEKRGQACALDAYFQVVDASGLSWRTSESAERSGNGEGNPAAGIIRPFLNPPAELDGGADLR